MPGKFGRGYVPDRAGHRTTSFAHHPAAKAATTPDAVDHFAAAPGVFDQGQYGSCTGHGTSAGIVAAFDLAGVPMAFVPSPAGIYDLGRCIDRAPLTGTPLTDSGAEPNQVMRGIAEWGVRPMGPLVEGRYSDCGAANVNAEPDIAAIETDACHLEIGAYAITSVGADRVADVRKALAAGLPVCFGVFVDTAFENWNPADGPVTAPDFADPSGGGHWLCALGYTTQADGTTLVRFRNSWGTSWGDGGNGNGDEAWVAAWMNIYVMAVAQ